MKKLLIDIQNYVFLISGSINTFQKKVIFIITSAQPAMFSTDYHSMNISINPVPKKWWKEVTNIDQIKYCIK